MKVAIVHYWLSGMGGGERVIESLCSIWPDADIYTHVCNQKNLSGVLSQKKITTTFISKLPFSTNYYRYYLPLMPLALEQLDLSAYDLVLSSESGPAKGIITRPDCTHLCYCHTPMRYLWDNYFSYLSNEGLLTRAIMRPIFHYLRMWDVLTANRVDAFAANSRNVAARINKHWRRKAVVIPPPVKVEAVAEKKYVDGGENLKKEVGDFYLFVGRLVQYKRVDLAIQACAELGRKLVIIGSGTQKKALRKLVEKLGAEHLIKFAGQLKNDELFSWYHAAKALIFPGEEDFGIVPVESMAAGTPVIAYGRGGVLESVKEGKSGVFFREQTPEALKMAILEFESSRFIPEEIIASTTDFSEKNFKNSFMKFAQDNLANKFA